MMNFTLSMSTGKPRTGKVSNAKAPRERSNSFETRRLRRYWATQGDKMAEIVRWRLSLGLNKNLKYYKGREKPVRVSTVFLWNEFGIGAPRRPAVGDLFKRKRRKYLSTFKTMMAVYLLPKTQSGAWQSRLNNFGKRVVFDIKNAIKAYKKKPNADYTVKKKGFNDPLIETRKMVNAWEYAAYPKGQKTKVARYHRDMGAAMANMIDRVNASNPKRKKKKEG